ncbi:MAG: hypothetical protein Q9167_007198 [Letrouitia subvulpina]
MSSVPLPKINSAPQLLHPSVHEPMTSDWRPLKPVFDHGDFCQGKLLRIVSWNINFMAPGSARRAFAIMSHLEEIFGDSPPSLVVMLQEVNSQSLAAILTHAWVRNNFVLSNIEAPQRYFTLMTSRRVQAKTWFRVRLPSQMERDALVVDIPILPSENRLEQTSQILRLCTTHLESLPEVESQEWRPLQLVQISALLKAPPTPRAQIVAGLVRGDMNPISPLDTTSHEAENVKLHDIWEEKPRPPIPQLKPFQKGFTFGKARGNTWGYQSRAAKSRKRLDKLICTGFVDTFPLSKAQDLTRKIGRLGIGVKTKVEVLESELKELRFVKD